MIPCAVLLFVYLKSCTSKTTEKKYTYQCIFDAAITVVCVMAFFNFFFFPFVMLKKWKFKVISKCKANKLDEMNAFKFYCGHKCMCTLSVFFFLSVRFKNEVKKSIEHGRTH